MKNDIMRGLTVNGSCAVVVFFLLIYISFTKNILDVYYLLFILITFFRVKYCEWKKYH